MLPKLYQKDGTTLIGTLTNCIECLVEEERNGIFEVTLQYPNNETISTSLVYDNIIICDSNDTLKDQKFRIYDTRRMMNNTIEVYARHISFDLAYDYINSIDITNQSCEYALNTIFRNSQFSTGYKGHSDIVNAQNYKISNCNALEAIAGKQGSIIDTFGTGAEILRDNIDIYVYNKRGNDNEVSIEYAKNLTGFELQENTDDLITRILPYATYTPEGGTQTRVDGLSCDSQYINNYSHPFIAEIDFSDKFEQDEVPTSSKLQTLAEQYFKNNKCDLPKQNWKIEFIALSKCVGYEGIEDAISLCDTVTIKDTRYNIDTKAKVIKTVYDVIRERYDSMELGEPRTTLGDIVNTGSEKGEQGPPGPQGPKGEDGNIGDFPDSLPDKPVLTTNVYGFASIELSWTYDNKPYYWYEVYASKTKDFTPNTFDLIHKGQTSSFLFQAKPNETWYFRVCAINSYGNRTSFSDQKEVVTVKVDDLSNYFTTAAIGQAVVGSLTADYMTAFIIKGHWIDAKNLSVTDGNGVRTLDIDSNGDVALNVNTLKINSKDVSTTEQVQSMISTSADGILSTVDSKMGKLSITGRNLLRNTDFLKDLSWWDYTGTVLRADPINYIFAKTPNGNASVQIYASGLTSDGYYYIRQSLPYDIAVGQTHTFSCYYFIGNVTVDEGVGFEVLGSSNEATEVIAKAENLDLSQDGHWKKVSFEITPTKNYVAQYLNIFVKRNGELFIGDIQISRGVQTDNWDLNLDDIQSRAEANSKTYTNTKIEQTSSSITSTVETIQNDLSNNYSTKSELIQTSNSLTASFNSNAAYNLLHNSKFFNKDIRQWYYWGEADTWGTKTDFADDWIAWGVPKDQQGGLWQKGIKLEKNTTYTLSVICSWQANCRGVEFVIEYLSNESDTTIQYTQVIPLQNLWWTRQYVTFTSALDFEYCMLGFRYLGSTNLSTDYLCYLNSPCLAKGTTTVWSPNPQEVYDGIITLDRTGIEIEQGNNACKIDSQALNFYSSGTNYSRIEGGQFVLTDHYGNMVGSVGRTEWNNGSFYNALTAVAGQTAGISIQDEVYGPFYVNLLASSYAGAIDNIYYEKGLNLIEPTVHTALYFRPYNGTQYGAKHIITNYGDGHGLAVLGNNETALGVIGSDNSFKVGLYVTKDTNQVNYTSLKLNGPLDCGGFKITNTAVSQTMKTQSAAASTFSLTRSLPTSYTIYGTMTFTKDEVRYVEMEPIQTIEEYDFDDNDNYVPTGTYTAYCELPSVLAENIEENYHINICKRSFGDYRILESNPYYFILESQEEGFSFTFEVTAKKIETPDNNSIIANNNISNESEQS